MSTPDPKPAPSVPDNAAQPPADAGGGLFAFEGDPEPGASGFSELGEPTQAEASPSGPKETSCQSLDQ